MSLGTHTIAAKTFVKNVTSACVFKIVKDGVSISTKELSGLLGVNWNQVSTCRDKVASLLVNNVIMTALERKTRSDFIRVKVRPFAFDFAKDDDYVRLNSFQGLLEVSDPRTGEDVMVHRRIWRIINKRGQHTLFLESDHYAKFQSENGGATVGYHVWHDALNAVGQFVSNPRKQSCVDEFISGLEHYMVCNTIYFGFICIHSLG